MSKEKRSRILVTRKTLQNPVFRLIKCNRIQFHVIKENAIQHLTHFKVIPFGNNKITHVK